MIYFTADMNDTFAEPIAAMEYEISTIVFDTNNLYVQPGLTSNETSLPVITCNEATISVPVIYVKECNYTTSAYTDN